MASTIVIPNVNQIQLVDTLAASLVDVATKAKADINTTQTTAATLAGTIQSGTITLASGTVTVNTGITITANSRIVLTRTAQGGTSTTVVFYDVTSKTVGAPSTGAFTVQARTAPGVLVNTDTSTLDYIIIN